MKLILKNVVNKDIKEEASGTGVSTINAIASATTQPEKKFSAEEEKQFNNLKNFVDGAIVKGEFSDPTKKQAYEQMKIGISPNVSSAIEDYLKTIT